MGRKVYFEPTIDLELLYVERGYAGSLENPIEGEESEW